INEHCFELVDLVVGPLPVPLARELLHPLHQNTAIPGAIENGQGSGQGQFAPESVEPVAPRLLWRRWAYGDHFHAARANGYRPAPNRASFAGGVEALNGNDGAAVAVVEPLLKPEHLVLELFQQGSVPVGRFHARELSLLEEP